MKVQCGGECEGGVKVQCGGECEGGVKVQCGGSVRVVLPFNITIHV